MLRFSSVVYGLLLTSQLAAQPTERSLERPFVEGFLSELSHDSLEGRGTFTRGIEKAARLIEREFRRAGLEPVAGIEGVHTESAMPYRQAYPAYRLRGRRRVSLSPTRKDADPPLDTLHAYNILGMIRGRTRPDQWVVFSAHYDHIGIIAPVAGDSIANGADDDGTGTTGVVAMAHHLAREAAAGRGPERSVLFVCFSGEEMGLLGSQHFAGTLLRPEQIVAGFNLEMLGKPSGRGPATAWISGWDKSNFGTLLNGALSTPSQRDSTFFPDPYPKQNIWQRSDHYSLARRGIPAHIIMSDDFENDKRYHTVDDEIGSLDLDHFAAILQKISRAAGPILNGAATPTRIKE
jgi:hypothetical protein